MLSFLRDIYKIMYFKLWRMRSYDFDCRDDGVVRVSGKAFLGYEAGVISTKLVKKALAFWVRNKVPEVKINVCVEVYRRYLTPMYNPLPVTRLTYAGCEVNKGKVALEIGGYLGIHSVYMATRWPQAEVHVFEPMPDNAEICSKNVELNGLAGRVHVHNLGVSSSAGSLDFQRSARQGASYIKGVIPNASVTQCVPSVSIDKFLRGQNIDCEKVVFARVQVNGAEADVLRGMKDTLSRGVNRLVVTTRYDNDVTREIWSYKEQFERVEKEDNTLVMTR